MAKNPDPDPCPRGGSHNWEGRTYKSPATGKTVSYKVCTKCLIEDELP